uniref:Forkhead box protein O n=1 Tax=Schmidtea mediterranea TaxID=79327 RepID=A0A822ZXU2_SCHMD|nr:TPA_exp: forkhead box O [Schmidtea mediterranea]
MNNMLDDCHSPEFRARSQTWGGNDNSYRSRIIEADLSQKYTTFASDSYTSFEESTVQENISPLKDSLPKILPAKKSSRKNPWGQETYSDLIEAAINSHPNQMATLQQIYEFISKNNKYFAERVDATSSAGWKNSIRHNLSLHDKFVKCPKKNENMKSSLWSINTKCYKRERSNSMDCKRSGVDLIARRKLLKEQRRHISSNSNIVSNSKISPNSDKYTAATDDNSIHKLSPNNQSSFTYDSAESAMETISDFIYKDNKLKYRSPQTIHESNKEMQLDSSYNKYDCHLHQTLHEDLQRLDVNSMEHYHYKKDQNFNYNKSQCLDFHRAALEYSRFIADIFIDDVE